MGVPGLWDILNKAGKPCSIAQLAVVNGFEQNASGRRAYRIGIDVSIWLRHGYYSKGGENHELRLLFSRLVSLLKFPIIPLFVFDGRERPNAKRGSRLGKSGSHTLSKDFKRFLAAFGMEWREARGEAEAELAFLNHVGCIDAVMTDDCDALIFGAHTVIKNISAKLSGNKNNLALNSAEKTDNLHTMVYRAADVKRHPDIVLTRGGLILFVLLSGGDYSKGVEKIGPKVAHGLAKCGFGDQLLQAFQQCFDPRVAGIFDAMASPHQSGVKNLDVLRKYSNPLITGTEQVASVALRDTANLDLAQVAQLCEDFFEWGYQGMILQRFRNFMWNGAVMHVLRRAALEADENERRKHTIPGSNNAPKSPDGAIGTPASIVQKYLGISNRADRVAGAFGNQGPRQGQIITSDRYPFITKVVGSRQHTSTDGILEYRVEISPVQLVEITKSGIWGKRAEPPRTEGNNVPKELTDPNTSLRLWIPATMLSRMHPALVEQFFDSQGKKKRNGKSKALHDDFLDEPHDLTEEEDSTIVGPSTRVERLCDQILDAPITSRKQKKKIGNEKACQFDDPIAVAPEFNSTNVFNPWFNASLPRGSTSGKRDRFLFTFRDPTNDIFIDESEDVVKEGKEDDIIARPQTRFERLCDQILDAAMYPRKQKKQVGNKRAWSSNFNQGPSKKRKKTSSDILDLTL